MSITSKQIAELCGVSRTTVDRALNNKPRISKKTKAKILKVAKEYSYRPALLARSLVKGRTFCIGVVVFDVRNHYFSQMLSSIELSCKANGYVVYFSMHEKDNGVEIELIKNLVDRKVDGLILCPVNKGPEFESFVSSLDIPTIIIGNKISEHIPCVCIDEKMAVQEATSFIISKGYKRICFVCPPLADQANENIYTHELRLLGFQDTIHLHKDVEGVVLGDWGFLEKSIDIAKNPSIKTAFFCSGDIYALQILKEFRLRGYSIPKQFGLMGFDNIDMLDYILPPLTTVKNSVEEVAKKSVEQLLKLISHEEIASNEFVPYEIVYGDTIID